MDIYEIIRRFRRYFELVTHTYRRVVLVSVGLFVIIWVFGTWFFPSSGYRPAPVFEDPIDECLHNHLSRMNREIGNLDTVVQHLPKLPDEQNFLPYVGNGFLGLVIMQESTLHIKVKNGRVLSLPLPFRPLVRVVANDEMSKREAIISQYVRGIVQHVSCVQRDDLDSLVTISKFYAHRTHPTILEQQISVSNPSRTIAVVKFQQLGWSPDNNFKTDIKTVRIGDEDVGYMMARGTIQSSKGLVGVAIGYNVVPNAAEIKGKSSTTFRFITTVNYVYIASKREFDTLEKSLMDKSETELMAALRTNLQTFQALHETAWGNLWTTGFYISPSKAFNSINGDTINATIYYVLSQVRAPLYETNVAKGEIVEANAVLNYAEGCYGGHHTLQAKNLWSTFRSEREIVEVSNIWLLTLQRLGCHNLLRAGASGVIQGMVLSFGGLKFSNYHLEFNMEPKDLHRDFLFRRIAYGNGTHVNISVSVEDDNKAVLFAALDRSEREYFACDGGCLDAPVKLGPLKKQFPVKLTDPVTSILYITSDRSHIEELRLSIHVKEVQEAPAHEHHILSMHKHGSGHGTMSTMFWISVSIVIILFHLFLFHLIYTEYFGPQEKFRSR